MLLDFAHNLAGLAAIAELVRGLPERSVALGFGMAGDRSDEQLRELGAALLQFEPTWVILREQPDYLRGRGLGEVPALLEQGLLAAGCEPARTPKREKRSQAPRREGLQISTAADEPATIEQAIEAGAELIVILVHTEREAVERWLRARGAQVDSLG